ncbi:hypothetical protein GL177_10590 [Vibrio toranzoniae]|uniref:hypothetical protein n=1 Tax=Vibrio toranzoniae TaxID=1194427 RepID=UPI001378B2E6|nr:hypothetical protein [Vibrio toranzoniae]NAZ53791.1 hypothetical protein [Vibrio toranzoniae]
MRPAERDSFIDFVCAEFFHEIYGSLRCELTIDQKAFLFKRAKDSVKLEAKSIAREYKQGQHRI